MITITQAVEQTIAHSPLYGEAMLHDIVNFSSLARKIQPSIESILLEPIAEGSITIALKRLASVLRRERATAAHQAHPMRSISLRSGLTVLIYQNSPVLQDIHQKILSSRTMEDAFVHFAQGSRESSFVVSDSCLPMLKKLAAKERLIASYPDLSAISVRMPPEVMHVTGVFAPFVQTLAWQHISVYQIVSHFTEITFVVSDQDADKAFGVIKSVAAPSLTPPSAVSGTKPQ